MRRWMKELRLSKGYTQADISEKVGISRSYYTQLECGYLKKLPSTHVAKKLGKILCFDWILFYEDNEK